MIKNYWCVALEWINHLINQSKINWFWAISFRKVTEGATHSVKLIIEENWDWNGFFIKKWEKVFEENKWYELECIKWSHLFVECLSWCWDDILITKKDHWKTFDPDLFEKWLLIKKLQDIIGLINKDLWGKTRMESSEEEFKSRVYKYIEEKKDNLRDGNSFLFLNGEKYDLQSLISNQIVYNWVNIWSIKSLVDESIEHLKIVWCQYMCQLHWDLKASNILVDGNNVKLVDLWNMHRYWEYRKWDPAFDLAKLINSLERFHKVDKIRDALYAIESNREISFIDNDINVVCNQINDLEINYEKIALEMWYDIDALILKVPLYQLLLNFITLKRHSLFPEVHHELLWCILESAYWAYKKIKDINETEQYKTTLNSIKNKSINRFAIITDILWKNWIRDFKFDYWCVWKTNKCAFGKIYIAGNPYFYKLWPSDLINMEEKNYWLVSWYKREKLISNFSDGEDGVLLYDFNNDFINWGKLLQNFFNDYVDWELSASDYEMVSRIYETIWQNYINSLIVSDNHWPNDKFFWERLVDWWRFDQYYLWSTFILDDVTKIKFEDILDFQIRFKNNDWICLWRLIDRAKQDLNYTWSRYLVNSPWDLTEQNITSYGTFFDFETGWNNALCQEIAIRFDFNCIKWGYLIPMRNSVYWSESVKNRIEKLIPKFDLSMDKKVLDIDFNFNIWKIRKENIKLYLEHVIRKLPLTVLQDREFIQRYKSSVLMRMMWVINLTELTARDQVIMLWLLSLFLSDYWEESISDHFEIISCFI